MPQPTGAELGIRSPFSIRVGLDVQQFKGMNRDSDAGAIGNEQFWLLQNVRLDGAGIKCRPGLSTLFSNAMGDCGYGVFDDLNPNDGDALFWENGVDESAYGPEVWSAVAELTLSGVVHGTLNGYHFTIDNSGTGYTLSYTTASQTPSFTQTQTWTTSGVSNTTVLSALEFGGKLWFVLAEAVV